MPSENNEIRRLLFTEIFFLGFTLIGAQIILLREFLLVFNGNELVVGMLFAIWMVITAFGSWFGRFIFLKPSYLGLIRVLMVFITVYPLIAAFSIEYFRNVFVDFGRMISLYEAMIYSTAILLPLCGTGGLLFTLINSSGNKEARLFKNLYSIESLGSVAGGLLISLFFIYQLEVNNFRSLTYLILINFVYFGISDFKIGKQFRSFGFLVFAIAIMFFIYNIDLDRIAKEKLYHGQELLLSKETPYGNLSITKAENQINIFRDGIIYYTNENVIQKEEDVHYAMLQNPNAKAVLLIGGGITGTIEEILKYSAVQEIAYVEMDPILFTLQNVGFKESTEVKIKKYAQDPVLFLQNSNQKFDVILINQSPPSNAQFNRFYTVNFYQKLKRFLNRGGVISCRLPSSSNYLSSEEVTTQATIYNSLQAVYNYVMVVPAGLTYFIASDKLMALDYVKKLSDLGLENIYINTNYLNDDLMRFRSDQILATYSEIETLNYNFKPVVYISYIRQWLNYYDYNFWFIPLFTCIILLIFIISAKPNSLAIFSSGFTGVGVELVLIIVFQVLLGYMYYFIGILITIFMAGLAFGSLISKKISPEKIGKQTFFLQLITGIFIIGLSGIFVFLEKLTSPLIIQFIIVLCMLSISILVGLQYGLSVTERKSKSAIIVSKIYSADLIGSALGSMITVVILIPFFGIYISLYCLAGLHFLTLLANFLKKKFQYL